MKKSILFLLMVMVVPGMVMASSLKVGDYLPDLKIKGVAGDEIGRLVLSDSAVTYADFDSSQLKGKMRSVLYIAATLSAADINVAFTDALTKAELPPEKYQTTIIMNMDRALWGTGGMVRGKVEDKQKATRNSMFVIDEEGDGLKSWGIQSDYAVILIDQQGKIVAIKDDKLSQGEIDNYLEIIKNGL